METAAPGERDGGEAAKKNSTGPDSFNAEPPAFQAPAFRPVGDIARQIIARISRRVGVSPILVVGGRR